MWPYWFLFLLPAYRAISNLKTLSSIVSVTNGERWPGWWRVVFGVLVLIVGLRHEVGADWYNYLELFNFISTVSLQELPAHGDPAYILLNKFAAELGLGIYFVNTVCAALFAWGLLAFCRNQPRSWLALTVAVPYLVTVVAMGYSRQGVAIGLAMLGLLSLGQGRILSFILWLAFAATFHKSTLILMPFVILAGTKRPVFTFFWLGIACTLLYALLLHDSVLAFQSLYIEGEMESSGAAIRVFMNALPASLFLILCKRFKLESLQRSFWAWMSWFALALVVLLLLSPSSTAIDRLALYWIPLQLFVWSRLPEALGRSNIAKTLCVLAIIVYSATVLLVWLQFAAYASEWLPYKFFPAVWFGNMI
jgi:hypothetical protein